MSERGFITGPLNPVCRPAGFSLHPGREEEAAASQRDVPLLLLLLQQRSQRGSLRLPRNHARYSAMIRTADQWEGSHSGCTEHRTGNELKKKKEKKITYMSRWTCRETRWWIIFYAQRITVDNHYFCLHPLIKRSCEYYASFKCAVY